MSTDPNVVEIVSVLRILTAQLVLSDDLDDALGRLAETSADLLLGDCSCGVTVVTPEGITTAASSSGLPELLAKVQYDTGGGPCMSAIQGREMTVAQDLRHEDRWQDWTARAVEYGVLGVLATPVDIDDQIVGALSLYSGEVDQFSPEVELTAMLLAEHAGLLIGGVLDRSRHNSQSADLAAALADGATLNRAVGIVMAQRSCGPQQALDVLHSASATLRVPLGAIAERLVDTVASRSMPPQQHRTRGQTAIAHASM